MNAIECIECNALCENKTCAGAIAAVEVEALKLNGLNVRRPHGSRRLGSRYDIRDAWTILNNSAIHAGCTF